MKDWECWVVSCCVKGDSFYTATLVGYFHVGGHQSSVYCSVSNYCSHHIGCPQYGASKDDHRLDTGRDQGWFLCHRKVRGV